MSYNPEYQRQYALRTKEKKRLYRIEYARKRREEAKARYVEVTWKTKLKASLQKKAAELAKRRTMAAQLSQVLEMRL